MKEHRAVQILVFGILSFVVCPFFGVAAWVMGNNDLREMAQGRMDPSGRDMTKAGRICGMVGTGLLIFQVVLIGVVLISMALFRA
jgi:type IV secretory pathway TrbD component